MWDRRAWMRVPIKQHILVGFPCRVAMSLDANSAPAGKRDIRLGEERRAQCPVRRAWAEWKNAHGTQDVPRASVPSASIFPYSLAGALRPGPTPSASSMFHSGAPRCAPYTPRRELVWNIIRDESFRSSLCGIEELG